MKDKIKTLRILLTDKCNLNCFYCCAEGHRSKYNNFNYDNIKTLIRNINEYYDIRRIKLTGGEPLCYTDINSIINAINEAKKSNQLLSLVTNGTKTSEIKSIVKNYDIDLTISLPSINKDVYDRIVQKNSEFKNVIETITYLNDINYDFKLNCVLVEEQTNTYENVKKIIDAYGDKHNIEIRFLELSINEVNKNVIDYSKYKTNYNAFDIIMEKLGFIKSPTSDKRESVLYSKDGVVIKYIKFFCCEKCNQCPEDKTSIWISCDGCVTRCSFNEDKSKYIDNFSNHNVSTFFRENSNCL